MDAFLFANKICNEASLSYYRHAHIQCRVLYNALPPIKMKLISIELQVLSNLGFELFRGSIHTES